MDNNEKLVEEKLGNFIKIGLILYGNEIELPSNAFFSFNEILEFDNQTDESRRFAIQYGYPQSGCVSLTFDFNLKKKKLM